jgi:hypothetical protein
MDQQPSCDSISAKPRITLMYQTHRYQMPHH